MSKILTVGEKQLATEVYAQRLAYISVTGREPDALDTITTSGYLNCWNEAIAAVGDPFTDSGQVLLTKLQQKATFHGQKNLYHRDFAGFLFRVLYTHFVKGMASKLFSEIPHWAELDFNQDLADAAEGIDVWLSATIGAQTWCDSDCQHFANIISSHKYSNSRLLTDCITWANIPIDNPLPHVMSFADSLVSNIFNIGGFTEDFQTKLLNIEKERNDNTFEILHKQAQAQIDVEREVYKTLFFIDPGQWNTENYLNNKARVLEDQRGYSDLLAVKFEEGLPLEQGWGLIYDSSQKQIYCSTLDGSNVAEFLISDCNDVEGDIVHNYLYHRHFIPIFLRKLGVEVSDIEKYWQGDSISAIRDYDNNYAELRAGTPARISHTAHWLGITYQHLACEDWQYLFSLLIPILEIEVESTDTVWTDDKTEWQLVKHTGKFSQKYPTVQRAVDYARFKASTLPRNGQPLLIPTTANKQLIPPIHRGLTTSVQNHQKVEAHPEKSEIESILTPTEITELGYALLKSGKIITSNQAEFVRALARFLGQGELATAPEKTLGKLLDRNDPTRLLDTLKQGLEEYAQTKAARR